MDEQAFDLAVVVAALAERDLRRSTGAVSWTGTRYEPVFDPPLSTEERVTLERLFAIARQQQAMTPSVYDAVRADMQTLRSLRQMGRNSFMGLSAAERDRRLYDALEATTRVFIALLRDEQS